MRDKSPAEALLALVTSSDRAEAIVGDLTEERSVRGWAWFWFHLLRTTFALFGRGFASAPLTSVALAVSGCALFTAPALAGVAAIYLFPGLVARPVGWLVLSFFWWSGALWTGVSLVSIAPKRGPVACLILAIAGELFVVSLWLVALRFERPHAWLILVFISALLAAVPLLAGSAIVRRRMASMTALLLLAVAGPASAQLPAQWKDPSPHTATLVTVEDGVQLEVLDWGGPHRQGSGQADRSIVLLAGLGDTAHVFDDVAPMLATRYRVVAVTRRGHPGSSAPAIGYGFVRLAEDVVRVMDAVGLKNAIVVGHSFAGEEMHILGARYSTQIAGLVYVDAAFDRGDVFEEHEAAARALPGPPGPKPADLVSFTALNAFLQTQGARWPEGRLRTRYVANADGSVRGRWTPEPHVLQALSTEMRAAYKQYNPERIRVPALAIYAVPKSARELMQPWYDADDPAVRERVEKLFPLERENIARHASWFAAFAQQGRISELSGGHDLVVSNPGGVLEQIEGFVSSLQERP